LYFFGSKPQEGIGYDCILIDPNGKHTLISCRLEFQCTNNMTKYEVLVQGLKNVLYLNVKCIKVIMR
jgi:hypothetical protein